MSHWTLQAGKRLSEVFVSSQGGVGKIQKVRGNNRLQNKQNYFQVIDFCIFFSEDIREINQNQMEF